VATTLHTVRLGGKGVTELLPTTLMKTVKVRRTKKERKERSKKRKKKRRSKKKKRRNKKRRKKCRSKSKSKRGLRRRKTARKKAILPRMTRNMKPVNRRKKARTRTRTAVTTIRPIRPHDDGDVEEVADVLYCITVLVGSKAKMIDVELKITHQWLFTVNLVAFLTEHRSPW
jgi:hypothetical protein